jgi:transposase
MLGNGAIFNKVMLVTGYTDLRRGIDGLATIVYESFGQTPFEPGVLFLFCGRRTDRIKGLIWEGDGFLLLYKRLEQGRFQWPRSKSEVQNLSAQQYRWLMEGLSIDQKKAIPQTYPKKIA